MNKQAKDNNKNAFEILNESDKERESKEEMTNK